MQAEGDYTVNAVGPENATKPMTIWPDATTELVDGFIRDGWILPENRNQELAGLYQGQMRSAQRQLREVFLAAEEKRYAAGWVFRILDYMTEGGE